MELEDAFQYKLIYIFSIDDERHRGRLKIGDTTLTTKHSANNLPPNCSALNDAAEKRIKQYTQTAGIPFNLRHTELAVTGDISFRDYHVHRVLKKYRSPIPGSKAHEWFKVDLDIAIEAIAEVKRKLSATNESPDEFTFRPDQEEAIAQTVKYFKKGKEFLWNAKMRFGKTLCALEVVRRMNFSKTIIITHRPVVNVGWYDDFRKIFRDTDYEYFDKEKVITAEKNFVYFASIQDLRGSKIVNDKSDIDKNSPVFHTPWDLVIVDEAHEGTTTALGKTVIKTLVKENTKVLELSGTPFNILERYGDNVYTWDYVSEQRAKAEWDFKYFGDSNPYADLPQMHIYTYDLGKVFNYIDAQDKAFNFREFFRTRNDRFVHEKDVKKFLDMLGMESDNNYPFSRPEFRELFKHTLWIVPGVKEGRVLSEMLNNHPAFCTVEIVNVAGDGDSDDEPANALEKVKRAIEENDYTITLSCGKLTAGVTVPEWTAVLYLAGGYSTSAANYLQTIFRVQSPCNIGGKVKTNCYVFDFAPDRTLKMITQAAAISPKAGKTKDGDRAVLGELLNFCPVIALGGSEMKYTADKLLRKLKRAWIERAVQNGFDDNSLYNDKLLCLSDLDLEKFDDIDARISSSKGSKDIDVNKQGLDREQRERTRLNSGTPRTPEQAEHDEKLRRRRRAISTLRNVSIRMPLLIYGADVPFDEDITIDEFAGLVDDASWEEFMPKGFTKKDFANIIEYYDPEIFIGTGNEVRERAKAADELKPTERVKKIAELFSTFKNPDKETVLTPWRVVNLHLSAVFGGYDFFDAAHQEILDCPRKIPTEIFTPDKKILEINSKTGLYPLYVAYSIFRARLGEVDENKTSLPKLRRLWDETVAENLFVICKTTMAAKITRRTLLGWRGGTVNTKFYRELLVELKNIPSRFINRITEENFWNKGVGKMFFDAVVGNPPYQSLGSGDNKNFAAPVYNLFMENAFKLADKVSLVHPARCLFNAGATPQEFRNKLLANPHLKVVRYEPNSKNLFPSSDIKGGVAITLHDANKNFGAIGTFIPFDELISIHKKVVLDNPNFRPLSEIIYSRTIYNLTDKMHEDFPNAITRQSKGHPYDMSTNILSLLPEIFLDDKPNDGHEYVQILGLLKMQRVYKWIRRDYVNAPAPFEKFKVFVPDSNGSGALGEVLSTPLVGTPLVGNTETFITVGAFDTRSEAEACITYIRSKFCRVMLGILKVTQHNPPATWAKVPLQDFTSASDIDWSGNVDEQLYRKYKLNDAEKKFIEEHVRAMT